MKAMEAINKRFSVRSYSDKPVEEPIRRDLEKYWKANRTGPFGSEVRFKMLNLGELTRQELRPLGTYGVIRGAPIYILAAVKKREGAFEDLGYCMEKVILKATDLGLGTCWLAGTFKRSAFASKMQLAGDEMLPAITPLGYPAEKTTAVDQVFRISAGSKKRKPWALLFFTEDAQTPLTEMDAGSFRDALEAVRLGPSASNRQPWRVIRESGNNFHFYLKENKIYNRILSGVRLQNIDMGIAMCHFELVVREQALTGEWVTVQQPPGYEGLCYIATWAGVSPKRGK